MEGTEFIRGAVVAMVAMIIGYFMGKIKEA